MRKLCLFTILVAACWNIIFPKQCFGNKIHSTFFYTSEELPDICNFISHNKHDSGDISNSPLLIFEKNRLFSNSQSPFVTESKYSSIFNNDLNNFHIKWISLIEFIKFVRKKDSENAQLLLPEVINQFLDKLDNQSCTINEKAIFYNQLGRAIEWNGHWLTTKNIEKIYSNLHPQRDKKSHLGYVLMLIKRYRDDADYVSAHKVYTKALNEYIRNANIQNQKVLSSWAYEIYEPIGDSLRAKRDIQKAIRLSRETKDTAWLAENHNNLARYYMLYKNYKAAIDQLDTSFYLNRKIGKTNRMGINKLNMGDCYRQLNSQALARSNLLEAIRIFNKTDFYIGKGFAFTSLLRIALANRNFQEAQYFTNQARYWASKASYHRVNEDLYDALSEYYQRVQQTDSSQYYNLKYNFLTEKAFSKDTLLKIAQHELKAKEEEISIISEQNKTEKNRASTKHYIIIAILSFLIIIIITLSTTYYLKRKKVIISRTSEFIEENPTTLKTITDPSEQDILIAENFSKLMLNQKLYLQDKCTLDCVAELLKTNKTYLSKAINSVYKQSYSYIINSYRINEAIKMLCSTQYDYLSMEGIASAVGFSSKSTFYRIFKEITGLTPNEYKFQRVEMLKNPSV